MELCYTVIMMKYFIGIFSIGLAIGLMHTPSTLAASSGDLISCPDFSAVYYIADDGSRWVFPNDKIYFSWYSNFDSVLEVPCFDLGNYPIGRNVPYQSGIRLVKIQSVSTVYAVSPGAVLHPIDSEDRAIELYGSDWANRVDDLSDAFFPHYSVLSSVPSTGYPDGAIIENTETGSYYFLEDDARRLVQSSDISAVLKESALERVAPFDGTTVGDSFDSDSWTEHEKLDQVGAVEAPVVETPDDLGVPVLEVSADIILNGEPYVISWEDLDKDNEDFEYELQEDSNQSFSSPLLVVNGKETAFSTSVDTQASPKFYYRVRSREGDRISAWSSSVRVDVLNSYIVDGVLDTSMPAANTLGLGGTDSSVGIAAANIFRYLDQILGLNSADDVSAGLTATKLADYLGWFMGQNGLGSQDRANDEDEDEEEDLGVYFADIKSGLEEFINWDGDEDPWQGFEAPENLSNKESYNNWTVEEISAGSYSDSSAITAISNALKDDYPVLGVFSYWNPIATGEKFNEARFYDPGDQIENSADAEISGAKPFEQWDVTTSSTGVGHGVTIVGYIPDYDTDLDDDTDDTQDYLIVYDAWSVSFSLMAVPMSEWVRFYIITPAESVAPQSTTNPSMTSIVASGDLLSVSWSVVAKATYYELQWDDNDDFTSPESIQTVEFDGVTDYLNTHVVTEQTTIYYRVRPYNEFGAGDWGSSQSVLITL